MSTTCKILKSTDGTDIYADATGDPKNPSVVFVHGMSFCGAVFDELFANKRLSERFYLVRYDMRGHGRSGKPETPEGHSSSLYTDDFMAVVRAFGLNKPIYVGWSLGAGVIADICINLHPLPISGAISLNGMPLFHPELASITLSPKVSALVSLMVSPGYTITLDDRRNFLNNCFHDPESVPFALRSAWLGYTVLQSQAMIRLVHVRLQDLSKLPQMKRGDLRFMALYGDKDKLVDGAAMVKELMRGKYLGGVEIEVKEVVGGSHSMFLDRMDEVVDAVIGFSESVQANES